MGEATTTNPWLVSLINMTIVFIVLIVLWGIMHVLYMVDPTKKKEEKKEAAPAPVVEEVAAPAEEEVAAALAMSIALNAGAAYTYSLRALEAYNAQKGE